MELCDDLRHRTVKSHSYTGRYLEQSRFFLRKICQSTTIMASLIALVVTIAATAHAVALSPRQSTQLLTDLSVISQYWGEISPYADNPENYFGVPNVGLPSGCQIEQVQVLQRHAQRFPTSGDDDGGNDERFASKVKNFTIANATSQFTGPLAFLNSYEYIMVGRVAEYTKTIA